MDNLQPIINKISQSQNILILAAGSNGDSLAASLALRAFLKKLEKEVALLSTTPVSNRFEFLPEVNQVSHQIDLTKTFVVNVSTKQNQLAELSYKKNPEQLSIFLKPATGEFSEADVSFGSSSFPFDLVILIGISSLEQLGDFYNQHTDLFFQVPVLNIDFKGSNENYGQMNLVEMTATSVSEIILDLINKFESSLIDETIATQLLAGIIAETNSFQHVRTTPQVFLKASQLVSLGAKQQEIVSNLYKTKSLGLLKLWGRVLARLKPELDNQLVYSAVNHNDLVKAGASEEDASAIIKEMAAQLSFAKVFVFLKEETNGQTTVFVHCVLALSLPEIFGQFAPQLIAPQTVKFTIPTSVGEAENQVLAILKSQIPSHT